MPGYYRFPSVYENKLYFISEDTIWCADLEHATPRAVPLTTCFGQIFALSVSPDGQYLAATMNEEGHAEVFVLPTAGGRPKRLTYLGDHAAVIGWLPDGKITFTSAHRQPFVAMRCVYAVDPETTDVTQLNTGMATWISCPFDRKLGSVIQRYGDDFGTWKRYRGGTAGQIWIDDTGNGVYKRLLEEIDSNFSRPLWIGDRIFFLSDHEGFGNLYSCWIDGDDLRRETHKENYYVRHSATDGEHIVFHCGGALYKYNPRSGKEEELHFDYHASEHHMRRKFIEAKHYLNGIDPHPLGHHVVLNVRSSAFVLSDIDGGSVMLPQGSFKGRSNRQYQGQEERYCFPRWLYRGDKIIYVARGQNGDYLDIITSETHELFNRIEGESLGRVCQLIPSPTDDKVIVLNHRHELILVDVSLKKNAIYIIERSDFGPIGTVDWSVDGQWCAYDFPVSLRHRVIKLMRLYTKKTFVVTDPVSSDFSPAFDVGGKYLYFISNRQPYKTFWSESEVSQKVSLYAICLDALTKNPFVHYPKPLDEIKTEKKHIDIHLEHITTRLCPFPVPTDFYTKLAVGKDKVYLLRKNQGCQEEREEQDLMCFDFDKQRLDTIAEHVHSFSFSLSKKWGVYVTTDEECRLFKAGEKIEDNDETPAHKQGWLQLDRLQTMVDPLQEWAQIYEEAWRLQRDFFWTEDMSKVAWIKVYHRYYPLVERLGSRSELNDVLWQMQGELGSSHAYVSGGDISKQTQPYCFGKLGATFSWDRRKKTYVIRDIAKGDSWDHGSPLQGPGLHIEEGSQIVSIDGMAPSKEILPEVLLMKKVDAYIKLVCKDPSGKNEKAYHIKTLKNDRLLYYRDWVERNRAYVTKASKGRLGYIHIPNMVMEGYQEFQRSFLTACDCEGLVVDIRFNGGGYMSELVLAKLARRRLGYDFSRWRGPLPYPSDAPHGAMVALANAYAGSDGDMFAHGFKMLGLGPLIGERTWGGVIGIEPRHPFVDHGYTTQPEFSMWFSDVEWAIENKGVEPDIHVPMMPQEYMAGKDPQLVRGIEECLLQVKENPPLKPHFQDRPDLSLPHTLDKDT